MPRFVPRSVTASTLECILSRHPCFENTNVLSDVSQSIVVEAQSLHLEYLKRMRIVTRAAFRTWFKKTVFLWKSPFFPALVDELHGYVTEESVTFDEVAWYRGRLFERSRRTLGINFAAVIRDNYVIWTKTRKAYVLKRVDGMMSVVQVLNRQDDPLQTWLKHFNGTQLSESYARFGVEWKQQNAFHSEVVVYFVGSDRLEFSGYLRRKNVGNWESMLSAVELVSLKVVPANDARRFTWRRCPHRLGLCVT